MFGALAEVLGSVPSSHVRLFTVSCNSREADAFFCFQTVNQNKPIVSHIVLVYVVTPVRKTTNTVRCYGLTVVAHLHSVTQARSR